jgi:hypothetical protein
MRRKRVFRIRGIVKGKLMLIRKIAIAGLPIVAFLQACQSDRPENAHQVASPESGEYQSIDQVDFLHDEQGNVPRHIPLEVLKDMRQQLLSQGRKDLVSRLDRRYDFISGEVKDLRAAEMAEHYLKSQLPQQAPQPAAMQGEPLTPDNLPAGIEIPDEMIERLNRAAAKGGAQ